MLENHNTKSLKNSNDDIPDVKKQRRLVELPRTVRDYVPAIMQFCGWGWSYATRQESFCTVTN